MNWTEKKDNISPSNALISEWSSEKRQENIFAELSGELDFWVDKNEKKEIIQKDKLYYIKLSWTIVWWINIWVFMILIFSWIFFYIQNNPHFQDKPFLDPFCTILLWEMQEKNTTTYCSSTAALYSYYTAENETLKQKIIDKLSWMINDTYIIENFIHSNEVQFLLANKNSRLTPLNMLNDFDRMKNDFSWSDKKQIQCKNIKINADFTMELSCDVYSSSWEGWIIWYEWDRKSGVIQWSSISIAGSFLNFIEKNSKYNFQLLEKQRNFSAESVVWEWVYVKKTTLQLKLKYNNLKTNLSL